MNQPTILDEQARQEHAKFGATNGAAVAAAYYNELIRNKVPAEQAAYITGEWIKAATMSVMRK